MGSRNLHGEKRQANGKQALGDTNLSFIGCFFSRFSSFQGNLKSVPSLGSVVFNLQERMADHMEGEEFGSIEPGSRRTGSSRFLVHFIFVAKMVMAWILKVGG